MLTIYEIKSGMSFTPRFRKDENCAVEKCLLAAGRSGNELWNTQDILTLIMSQRLFIWKKMVQFVQSMKHWD